MKTIIAAAAIALAMAAPATAQDRPFDPRDYQHRVVGQPTQILVIGTPHLSGAPDSFDPAVLQPLLQRLAAFRPDAICIEALPGRTITQMWDYRETHPGVAQTFGGRASLMAATARNGVGLSMPEAEAEMRRTMAQWPASPSPSDRRRLAALFAASGDPASALVQWWRLAPSDRIADDNVTQQLVDLFATYEAAPQRNERYLIASRLAVQLGLERVYPMDDQSDDVQSQTFEHDFDRFTNEPWFQQMLNSPTFAPLRTVGQRLRTPEEALESYRFLNATRTGHNDADGQWLNMINRASPNDVGRARVAIWETRNMRMAANIRETSTLRPGGRVLVIVGAAHKPWLDAYLSMMSDVQIVDAAAVLR